MNKYRILAVVGAVLAMATSAWASPVITTDLIAYYSFDDVGATVADDSGNEYDGTVVNNVTDAKGVSNGGAYFAPRSGDSPYTYNYISLPVADIYNDGNIPSSNFSVAAFCKVISKVAGGDSDHHTILGAKASDLTYLIHAELRPNEATPDYRFTLRGYGGNPATIGTYTPDASGIYDTWHHVAMTWDNATTTMSIYIDGDLLGSMNTCLSTTMAGDWDLGARIGANTDPNRQFAGWMDEVYIFKGTLSPSDVQTLAGVPEPSSILLLMGAALAGLLYWWKRRR